MKKNTSRQEIWCGSDLIYANDLPMILAHRLGNIIDIDSALLVTEDVKLSEKGTILRHQPHSVDRREKSAGGIVLEAYRLSGFIHGRAPLDVKDDEGDLDFVRDYLDEHTAARFCDTSGSNTRYVPTIDVIDGRLTTPLDENDDRLHTYRLKRMHSENIEDSTSYQGYDNVDFNDLIRDYRLHTLDGVGNERFHLLRNKSVAEATVARFVVRSSLISPY